MEDIRYEDIRELAQEADGCEGCAFVNVNKWEMPCERCRRNCKDYYRRAEQ